MTRKLLLPALAAFGLLSGAAVSVTLHHGWPGQLIGGPPPMLCDGLPDCPAACIGEGAVCQDKWCCDRSMMPIGRKAISCCEGSSCMPEGKCVANPVLCVGNGGSCSSAAECCAAAPGAPDVVCGLEADGSRTCGACAAAGDGCYGGGDCCGSMVCNNVVRDADGRVTGAGSCSLCGNGVVDPGEACDDNTFNGTEGSNCDASCQYKDRIVFCCEYGDGVQNPQGCFSDADCPDGTRCDNNECKQTCDPAGNPFEVCPNGSTCHPLDGVCNTDCTDDPGTVQNECDPGDTQECNAKAQYAGALSPCTTVYRSLNSCENWCGVGLGGVSVALGGGFWNCGSQSMCLFQDNATTGYATETECVVNASVDCAGTAGPGGITGDIGDVGFTDAYGGDVSAPPPGPPAPPPPEPPAPPPPPGPPGPPPPPPGGDEGGDGGQASEDLDASSANSSVPSASSSVASSGSSPCGSQSSRSRSGSASSVPPPPPCNGSTPPPSPPTPPPVPPPGTPNSGSSSRPSSSSRPGSSSRSAGPAPSSQPASSRTTSAITSSSSAVNIVSSSRRSSASSSLVVLGVASSSPASGKMASNTSSSRGQSAASAACTGTADCRGGDVCVAGTCRPARCGDGVVSGAEQCEPVREGLVLSCAVTAGQMSCTEDCTWRVLPLCDDAASSRPFGLSAIGSSRPFGLDAFTSSRTFSLAQASSVRPGFACGDGVLGQGEECDDGNVRDGDGCTASCLSEIGRCGDGAVQTLLNEQCEPGVPGAVPCRADCRYLLLSCGDGRVDPGETCDMGAGNADVPGTLCRSDCSLARCGDRIQDGNEQCDDGNRVSEDGCSGSCRLEKAAGLTQVLPGMVVDLPLLAQQQNAAQVAGTILCNVPSDCPGGSVCAAGICAVTPNRAPAGDTGPAAAVLLGAAGASAGLAWVRRKRG